MSPQSPRQQLTILEAMVLIAGIAFGLWLFDDDVDIPKDIEDWVLIATDMLGGLTLAATPLFVVSGWRRRWRSGAFLWLGMGLVSWGLAPAIIVERLTTSSSAAPACFVYILPLIGLFFLMACGIAGRPIRRWWTCRGWWPEWLSMYVLCGWAVVGVYVLFQIYKELF
jgi:hypothetical protein